MTIEKIKLFNGELRYAVVEPFTSITKDKNDNVVTKTEKFAVEYKSGDKVFPAVFPVTTEGLAKAKEVLKSLKK